MVAAAALPGSRVEIEDVGLNPTRTGAARRPAALRRARRGRGRRRPTAGEPRGTIVVEGDRTGRVDIAPDEVPGLIDELPAIAALAAHGGEVTVRGAAELRVKESDRIAALVAGFRALGIDADERPDGFVIAGPAAGSTRPAAARRRARRSPDGDGVRDRGARRRAAVDASTAPTSVAISYPGFFETLRPARRVKADKIYLVGFMGPARPPWRARWPGGSTGRPWTSTS